MQQIGHTSQVDSAAVGRPASRPMGHVALCADTRLPHRDGSRALRVWLSLWKDLWTGRARAGQGRPPNVTVLGYFFHDHVSTAVVEQDDARVTPRRIPTAAERCPPPIICDVQGGKMPSLRSPAYTMPRRTWPRRPLNVTFGEMEQISHFCLWPLKRCTARES
jgi:hypothetical protein